MPRTPDRTPGESHEEGTVYDNLAPGNDPPVAGGLRYVDGTFRLRDSDGVFDPRHVSVSDNDTTAKALKDKLVAGTNVTIVENNDGGDETLTVNTTGGGVSGPLDGAHLSHSGTDDLNATLNDNLVPWDSETFKDTGITHSTVTNNSRITVDADGTYLVHCSISVIGNPTTGTRYQGAVKLRKNGVTQVGEPAVTTYARFTNGVNCSEGIGTWLVKLLASDYVEVLIDRRSARTTAMDMVSGESSFDIVNFEGVTGPQGPAGADGDLTEVSHRPLDQSVHLIAETSFDEYVYTGSRVDAIITWTTSGKTIKIREELFVYVGNKPSTITTKHYDGAGTLIVGETMVETYDYTGSKLDDVDRVVS